MAIQDEKRTIGIDIEFKPGRVRVREENLTAACIRQALKWGCHLFGDIQRQLEEGDTLTVKTKEGSEGIRDLLHGRRQTWGYAVGRLILCSSCNPLHAGHLAMAEHAAKRYGHAVDIELCVRNADKPALDYLTINERVLNFFHATRDCDRIGGLVSTNVPLFFDKAELFPGATFLVGTDTLDRILDYDYGIDIDEGLSSMEGRGNRFLVYPRPGYESGNIECWFTEYPSVFEFVKDFEPMDISSTAIRNK